MLMGSKFGGRNVHSFIWNFGTVIWADHFSLFGFIEVETNSVTSKFMVNFGDGLSQTLIVWGVVEIYDDLFPSAHY